MVKALNSKRTFSDERNLLEAKLAVHAWKVCLARVTARVTSLAVVIGREEVVRGRRSTLGAASADVGHRSETKHSGIDR